MKEILAITFAAIAFCALACAFDLWRGHMAMKTVCAWCRCHIRGPRLSRNVSHGHCGSERCRNRFFGIPNHGGVK
jgi:hypothetical protein